MLRAASLILLALMISSAFAKEGCNDHLARLSAGRVEATPSPKTAPPENRFTAEKLKIFLRSWRFELSLAAMAGAAAIASPEDGRPVVVGIFAYIAWRGWVRWRDFRAARASAPVRDPQPAPATELKSPSLSLLPTHRPTLNEPVKTKWPDPNFGISAPKESKGRESLAKAGATSNPSQEAQSRVSDQEIAAPKLLLTQRPPLTLGLEPARGGEMPIRAGHPTVLNDISPLGASANGITPPVLLLTVRPRYFHQGANWPNLTTQAWVTANEAHEFGIEVLEPADPTFTSQLLLTFNPQLSKPNSSEGLADSRYLASLQIAAPTYEDRGDGSASILLLTKREELFPRGTELTNLGTIVFNFEIDLQPDAEDTRAVERSNTAIAAPVLRITQRPRFFTRDAQWPSPERGADLDITPVKFIENTAPVLLLTYRPRSLEPNSRDFILPQNNNDASRDTTRFPIDRDESTPRLLLTQRPTIFGRDARWLNQIDVGSDPFEVVRDDTQGGQNTDSETETSNNPPVLLLTARLQIFRQNSKWPRLAQTEDLGSPPIEKLVPIQIEAAEEMDSDHFTRGHRAEPAVPLLLLTQRPQYFELSNPWLDVESERRYQPTATHAPVESAESSPSQKISAPILLLTFRPKPLEKSPSWPPLGQIADRANAEGELTIVQPLNLDQPQDNPDVQMSSGDSSLDVKTRNFRLDFFTHPSARPIATALLAGLLSVVIIDPAIDPGAAANATAKEANPPTLASDHPFMPSANFPAANSGSATAATEGELTAPPTLFAWREFSRNSPPPAPEANTAPMNGMLLADFTKRNATEAKAEPEKRQGVAPHRAKVSKVRSQLKKSTRAKPRTKRR